MEDEQTVCGEIHINRKSSGKQHSIDDVIFMIIGEATIGNILIMVFAAMFFTATPIAMLLLFGTYSGGMRWLIALGVVTMMAAIAAYLMRKGIARHEYAPEVEIARTSYPGELTKLSDGFSRAADGYLYSQQVIRERLCEIAIDKIALARGLDREQVTGMLEKGDTACVGDDFLAQFLRVHMKGAQTWEESQSQAKGKSKERGERFMLEIDEVLKHVEATT